MIFVVLYTCTCGSHNYGVISHSSASCFLDLIENKVIGLSEDNCAAEEYGRINHYCCIRINVDNLANLHLAKMLNYEIINECIG